MTMIHRGEGTKLIRCHTGGADFCLDIDRIRGIVRADALERRPEGDRPGSYRSGGADWSVYDSSRWFGPAPRSDAGQVLLLESKHGRFGICIDRVTPIGRVAEDRILPCSDFGSGSQWMNATYLSESGPLAVVDAHRLNAPEEAAPTGPSRPRSAPSIRNASPQTAAERWMTIGNREIPGGAGRAVSVAVPVSMVAEVIDALPALPIPGSRKDVRGFIEWRGRPLLVVDPANWAGLPALETSPRVVVVRVGERTFGLAAGTTVKVLSTASPCLPTRYKILGETPVLAFDTTEQTIISVDWDRFFGSI